MFWAAGFIANQVKHMQNLGDGDDFYSQVVFRIMILGRLKCQDLAKNKGSHKKSGSLCDIQASRKISTIKF